MKGSELKRLLKSHGCQFFSNGSEHDVWITKDGNKFRIPRHDSQEIKKGTLNAILRQAGIK